MINILGTLKGVQLKSKVEEKGQVSHHIQLSLEITQGEDQVQEIVENLRQLVQINIEPKQPSLTKPVSYPDN